MGRLWSCSKEIFNFISKTRVKFPSEEFALDLSLARPVKRNTVPARLPHGFLNKIENLYGGLFKERDDLEEKKRLEFGAFLFYFE